MDKQFLRPDGTPDTSFGVRRVHPEYGATPGVTFRIPEEIPMTSKAEKDGVYTLNGGRFVIKAGDVLPEGAVMDEVRAEKAAPENRAEKAAPENRSAKSGKGDK